MKKKTKSKALPTFVGNIPIPSVAEQIKEALKESSPNYPQSIVNQLAIPDADMGIFSGIVKYQAQNNIFLTKKQVPFRSVHSWHNVAASIFKVTSDYLGQSFANKIIYIKQVIIQHTALAGASAGDNIIIEQESSAQQKFFYPIIDIASTQKEPLSITFEIPIRLTDYYYLDRPVVGAAEYFELHIYGWLEDK